MRWLGIWFILAIVMVSELAWLHPPLVIIGLAFLAWCGGVVSLLAWQEFRVLRKANRRG